MANPNPSPETRFQPGNRANPGGRPKGRSLTALLRDKLDEEGAELGVGTNAERVVAALITAATAGDVKAIKDIFDRVDGKVLDGKPDDADEAEQKPRIIIPGADDRSER